MKFFSRRNKQEKQSAQVNVGAVGQSNVGNFAADNTAVDNPVVDKKLPGDGLINISMSALIRLRHNAASIPLKVNNIRSAQTGNYSSPFKGRGMEFDESRLYQAGDDVRSLDWRVTARTGKPHTKLYREERERSVILWVDYRLPMFFATRGAFKSVLAAKAAATIAWSAAHRGDRLGSLIFSEDEHIELRPQRGKSGVLHFIKQLSNHSAWQRKPNEYSMDDFNKQKSSAQQSLARLRRVVRPGSLIFLMSDFRYLDEKSRSHLIQLSKHNDVVVLFFYDLIEKQLPPAGTYRMSDNKNTLSIDTSEQEFRDQYSQKFLQHQLDVQRLCRQTGMYYMECATNEDVFESLKTGLGYKVS